MGAILGIILGLAMLLGPLYLIPYFYGKRKPSATVGEVGPWIILTYVVELVILFAIMAAAGG